MTYFPQLKSGSICQYPVQVVNRYRTLSEQTMDGGLVKWSDPDFRLVEWKCEYTELDFEEMNALQSFHSEMEGKLKTFTFLDPVGNLFRWSEDLQKSVWIKDPYISIQSGFSGPVQASHATQITNTGAIEQVVAQSLPIPGHFTVCFSCWVNGSSIQIIRRTETQQVIEYSLKSGWNRVDATFSDVGSSLASSVGIMIPAGESIQIFGLQVEAQPGASSYKKTAQQSGIFQQARFAEDRLTLTAFSENSFGCVIKIQAIPGA